MKRKLGIVTTLILCVVVLVSSVGVFADEVTENEGVWKVEPSFPAYNYSNEIITSLGNDIFVMGGRKTPQAYHSFVNIYNVATGKWRSGSNMPSYRDGAASVGCNSKVYVIGGRNAIGAPVVQQDVDIYDVKRNEWSEGAKMPTAGTRLTASVVNDKIYAIGASQEPKVQIYNTKLDTWTTAKSMDVSLYDLVSTVVGSKIYVVGVTYNTNNVIMLVYDTISDTWEQLPESKILSNISHAALCTVGKKIYLIGGRNEDASTHTKVQIYDTVTGEIAQGPELPEPRQDAIAGAIGDRIYVSGGSYTNIISLPIPRQLESPKIATSLSVDQTMQLTPIEDVNINWSSTDTSIASVDNKGKVTAIKKGIAYIFAKSTDGTTEQSLAIKVTEPELAKTLPVVTDVKWMGTGAVVTATGDKKVVMYGVSATKDPAAATWKSNNNFANVKVGGTYYFFVKDDEGNISEPFEFKRTE